MNFEAFVASVGSDHPPEGMAAPLKALWFAKKGDWHKAHALAQEAGSGEGDWVHAHLHRVEGDEGNAAYWYRRCGREKPACSLEKEWEAIARALLGAV